VFEALRGFDDERRVEAAPYIYELLLDGPLSGQVNGDDLLDAIECETLHAASETLRLLQAMFTPIDGA